VVDDGPIEIAFDVPDIGRHGLADQGEKELLKKVVFLGLVVGLKTDDGTDKTAMGVENLGGCSSRIATEPFISLKPYHYRVLQKATLRARQVGRTLSPHDTAPAGRFIHCSGRSHKCNLHGVRIVDQMRKLLIYRMIGECVAVRLGGGKIKIATDLTMFVTGLVPDGHSAQVPPPSVWDRWR
jgi:hypothetical protein